jgi:hypothetical protein
MAAPEDSVTALDEIPLAAEAFKRVQPLTDMNQWVRGQVVAPVGAQAPGKSLGRTVGQDSRKTSDQPGE